MSNLNGEAAELANRRKAKREELQAAKAAKDRVLASAEEQYAPNIRRLEIEIASLDEDLHELGVPQ